MLNGVSLMTEDLLVNVADLNDRILVEHWEETMKDAGFKQVLTSSLANESAQNFYRKLGYRGVGSFVLPQEASELIFDKEL